MRVLYRISKRTTPNSNYALHIPLIENGKPICCQNESDKSLSSYEWTEGKPTCKKCLNKFRKDTGRTYEDYEAIERLLDNIAKLPLVSEIRIAN